jgi:hypothetical protein
MVFDEGLVVSRIYQVVEYSPAKCFQTLGEAVSDAPQTGDADPNKKIIAETNKLDGNSSYGKTVTNNERHTDVIYCKDRYVHQYLVDSFFRKCNQLNEDTFEVEMSKKTITLDLPLQLDVSLTSTPNCACDSFITISWTSSKTSVTFNIAAWTLTLHIWFFPQTPWKKS